MKIAFFGPRNFIDYHQIGGFESFIRRLALSLSDNGNVVDYVIYGGKNTKEVNINSNLRLKYFITFEDAVKELEKSYDHVFPIRLAINERPKYLLFLRKNLRHYRSNYIALIWPNFVKRNLMFIEANLVSYKGKIFCVSPRLYNTFKRWTKKAIFLYPPVPKEYFLNLDEKPVNDKIKITYLGNLTPDKYIEEVINLFIYLNKKGNFELFIFGTFDPYNPKSVKIHNLLKEQKEIRYVHINRDSYSPETDGLVREILKGSDILVQPYKTLINTLDTPLLLLEGMASLCAVLTTNVGSIKEIYGDSVYILPGKNFIEEAKILLNNLTYEMVLKERERIYKRNQKLRFDLPTASIKFIKALYE